MVDVDLRKTDTNAGAAGDVASGETAGGDAGSDDHIAAQYGVGGKQQDQGAGKRQVQRTYKVRCTFAE